VVRVKDWRRASKLALALGAVAGGVFALRWLLLPTAFFHQNGHGASWIAYALSDHPGLSAYGPGFAELFGWAARAAGSEPERGVFLLQALLGSLCVPFAWIIARGVGAGPLPAAAFALVVAVDPLLARLAQGNRICRLCGARLRTAAALAQSRLAALTRICGGGGVCGLFVSQAARIHPWLDRAGALPFVVVCTPGSLKRRLIMTPWPPRNRSIVAATSGGAMLEVLRGGRSNGCLKPCRAWAARCPGARAGRRRGVCFSIASRASARCAPASRSTRCGRRTCWESPLRRSGVPDRTFWPVLVTLACCAGGQHEPRSATRNAAARILGVALSTLQFRNGFAANALEALGPRMAARAAENAIVATWGAPESIFTLRSTAGRNRAFQILLPMSRCPGSADPGRSTTIAPASFSPRRSRAATARRSAAASVATRATGLGEQLAPYATPSVRLRLLRRR
jgi:hypothetical protein